MVLGDPLTINTNSSPVAQAGKVTRFLGMCDARVRNLYIFVVISFQPP